MEARLAAHLPVPMAWQRWMELVAVELASFGGGWGSPERWKTVIRHPIKRREC